VSASPTAATPPSPLRLLTDQCVQCGLCLPACPTYAEAQLETESPRGRIALVRAWDAGALAPTAAGDAHLDHCLGCRRCESVCPAGVRYGEILGLARTAQRQRRAPDRRQRALEWLVARPRWLQALLNMYRRLYPALPRALRPLPRPPGPVPGSPATSAKGASAVADTFSLFVGCVAGAYETNVRAALMQLCAAAGVHIHVPAGQGCCGSLHAHAGDADTAARLGAANRAAFAGAARVLTLASGCHAQLAESIDAPTSDALHLLAERRARLRFRPRPERIALHLPCTQRSASRSETALRTLLAQVPALEVVALDAGSGCCGAAGTRMLTDPAQATSLRAPLLTQLVASGATRLLSANIGCRLHLGNGTDLPVQHPLEFLAECLDVPDSMGAPHSGAQQTAPSAPTGSA
jgi:glycolate oxidase iron-sulfur subunit